MVIMQRRAIVTAVALSAMGAAVIAIVIWVASAALAPPPSEAPASAGASAPSIADAPGPVPPASARPIAELADPAWTARIAAATGIPVRALAAYAGATLAIEQDYPGCGVGWNTIAAIGEVESAHGSFEGSVLDDAGVVRPGIVGIALDGTASDVIRDTDGGALDGDAVWDRAVGPLQFIPETWALFARDGNADGVADPQQIDDAALTAAAYLCDAGGDLSVPANWIAAVAAYNAHTEYNGRVVAAANRYAAAR